MRTRYHVKVSLVLFASLCWSPAWEQQGCQDINALCSTWAGRGICISQKDLMAKNCPKTCGVCQQREETFVIPQPPTIAKPQFVCGQFDGVAVSSRSQRQFLGGILDAITDGFNNFRPGSASTTNNRPPGPNLNNILPSFGSFGSSNGSPTPSRPNSNPFPGFGSNRPGAVNTNTRPPKPSNGNILPGLGNILPSFGFVRPNQGATNPSPPNIINIFPSFEPGLSIPSTSAESEIFSTAVGGGSDASGPSVGAVFEVITGIIRPAVIHDPNRQPLIPRPVPVTTERPFPSPRPVTPIAPQSNPRPVIPPRPQSIPRPVTPPRPQSNLRPSVSSQIPFQAPSQRPTPTPTGASKPQQAFVVLSQWKKRLRILLY